MKLTPQSSIRHYQHDVTSTDHEPDTIIDTPITISMGARMKTTSVTSPCLEPPPQGESNQRQDFVQDNASTPTTVLSNEATACLLPK